MDTLTLLRPGFEVTFAPELATLAQGLATTGGGGAGLSSHPSSGVNSWLANSGTPPRAQSPLVDSTAAPPLGAPVPEPVKKNRLSLTFLRRGGPSKQAQGSALTSEDAMKGAAGVGARDAVGKRDKVNGHGMHATMSSTDGSSDRLLTQVSDNSRGEDGILSKVGSGMGSVKKRFSFVGRAAMGRKPSKSSVRGGRSGSDGGSDAFVEE